MLDALAFARAFRRRILAISSVVYRACLGARPELKKSESQAGEITSSVMGAACSPAACTTTLRFAAATGYGRNAWRQAAAASLVPADGATTIRTGDHAGYSAGSGLVFLQHRPGRSNGREPAVAAEQWFRAETWFSLEESGAGTPQAGTRLFCLYQRQTMAPPVMPAPAAVIRTISPLRYP